MSGVGKPTCGLLRIGGWCRVWKPDLRVIKDLGLVSGMETRPMGYQGFGIDVGYGNPTYGLLRIWDWCRVWKADLRNIKDLGLVSGMETRPTGYQGFGVGVGYGNPRPTGCKGSGVGVGFGNPTYGLLRMGGWCRVWKADLRVVKDRGLVSGLESRPTVRMKAKGVCGVGFISC